MYLAVLAGRIFTICLNKAELSAPNGASKPTTANMAALLNGALSTTLLFAIIKNFMVAILSQ